MLVIGRDRFAGWEWGVARPARRLLFVAWIVISVAQIADGQDPRRRGVSR